MTATKVKINKAECKRLAADERLELGLGPMDALDPWDLASEHGITVVPLSELSIDGAIRDHLTVTRPDMFSGALVPVGNGAVILENDAHAVERRRSTLGHELAHVLKEHRFEVSLVNEHGCRTADQVQEQEADEIAAELLVPFEAAKTLARQRASDEQVARQFGVSIALARWRMNGTGARIIAQRSRFR